MSLQELFPTDLDWQPMDALLLDALGSDEPMDNWSPSSNSSASREAPGAALLQGTVSLPTVPPQSGSVAPEGDAAGNLLVTVPRHKLVKMTRAELDAFVKDVTGGRKLTKEEVIEVRRQRKLIKNRLSASVCRKRKRAQVNQMEEKIKALEDKLDSTSGLEQKARALEERNRQLAERLKELEAAAAPRCAAPPAPVDRGDMAPTTTEETLDLTLMRKILECSPTLLQMYRQLQFYQKQLKCSSTDMQQAAVILTYTIAELNLLLATNLNAASFSAFSQEAANSAFQMPPSAQCNATASVPVTTGVSGTPTQQSTPAELPINCNTMRHFASFLSQKSAEAVASATLLADSPRSTAAPL